MKEAKRSKITEQMCRQAQLMRFQAAQVDKVIMKLDQIYNVANMILRAIRKE